MVNIYSLKKILKINNGGYIDYKCIYIDYENSCLH